MNILTPISNILISLLILMMISLTLIILKYSYRSTRKTMGKKQQQDNKNYHTKTTALSKSSIKKLNKIAPDILKPQSFLSTLFKSYFTKYSLLGTFFNEDKKYLLKETFIIALYMIGVLKINKIALYPIGIGAFGLIISYLIYEHLLKGNWSCVESFNKMSNKINCEAQSVEPMMNLPQISSENRQGKQKKIHENKQNELFDNLATLNLRKNQVKVQVNDLTILSTPYKSNFQIIILSTMSLLSVLMLTHSMLVISSSYSNIGELNLYSCLIALLIDQLGVRPTIFVLILIINFCLHFTIVPISENIMLQMLCEEQLIIKIQVQRDRFDIEMGASPTRKKDQSPSRIPKVMIKVNSSSDKKINGMKQVLSELDLLNLQPTYRTKEQIEKSQQDKSQSQDDEDIEEYHLQKLQPICQENEHKNIQNLSGDHTNRRKTNSYIYSYSAQKPIKLSQNIIEAGNDAYDGLLLINYHPPLNDYNKNNQTIDISLSPVKQTTRKAATRNQKRKNKRAMIITGSSPYLQYLPDMMKKIDKSQSKSNVKFQKDKVSRVI